MTSMKSLHDWYQRIETHADQRVADWLFVSSPVPAFSIVFLYIFILYVGPKFMSKRQPVDFGWFLPLYNFALVAVNFNIVKDAFIGSYNAGYSYVCTPLRRNSYDPNEMRVANAVWWFYISKFLELFDTVIFILRKRRDQMTFLHVYHHSTMPLFWWSGAKWIPGGQAFFSVMFNSGVHVVMYTYYGLAAMGPSVRKHLWWKKYLTIVQLVQFFCVLVHASVSLYVRCPRSPVCMHWAMIIYCISFLFLFGQFYINAYIKRKRYAGVKSYDSLEHKNSSVVNHKKTQ